jgi:hypothetical protein
LSFFFFFLVWYCPYCTACVCAGSHPSYKYFFFLPMPAAGAKETAPAGTDPVDDGRLLQKRGARRRCDLVGADTLSYLVLTLPHIIILI